MPVVGLGLWNLPSSEAIAVAIKNGYRHIDTASYYGTEPALGEAIKQCVSDGVVT